MKTSSFKYSSCICVLVASALVMTSCSNRGGSGEEGQNANIVPVEVDTVATASFWLEKTFSGGIEGIREARLFARLPETVTLVNVSVGQRVKEGAVLVRLDEDSPNSRYVQAKAVYENARDNYEKMKYLYEKKAISEFDFKAARTGFEVAEGDFMAARELIEISAPFDGVVTDVAVEEGKTASVLIPAVTVACLDTMRMKTYANSRDAGVLKPGQKVKVYQSQAPERTYPGVVEQVASSADFETRTFEVTILVENPDLYFRPGMYMRADIEYAYLEDVIAVPRRAVFYEGGVSKVYLVEGDVANLRAVETGPGRVGLINIVSGLSPGQIVVTNGQNRLTPGAKVKTISSAAAARDSSGTGS